MDGSVIKEKLSFKMLMLTFSSKLDWGWYIIRVSSRKLQPWFVLWSFLLLRLLCISINLPYCHAWNAAVISGLVLLVASWNCKIATKTDMQDFWYFPSCFSWTLGPLSKFSQLKACVCYFVSNFYFFTKWYIALQKL